MSNKGWAIVGVLALVLAGAWFASGSNFKGSFMPGGDRGRSSATPRGSSYSGEALLATRGEAMSAEAAPVNTEINRLQLAMLVMHRVASWTTDNQGTENLELSWWNKGYENCAKDGKVSTEKGKGGYPGYEYVICYMVKKNIMPIYPDGTWKPFAKVTREEAAKVFIKVFDPKATVPPAAISAYTDSNSDAVWILASDKIADTVAFKGPDSYFHPKKNLTTGRALFWIDNVKKNVPPAKWMK